MSRKRFSEMNCSVAQALEVVGDWWTLLVVREAFLGTERFADFQERLGIAKNILSHRLRRLVEHEILVREETDPSGRRPVYRLTSKGRDLWAVLTALRLWGDRWVYGAGNEPVVVEDRETGTRVARLLLADASGRPLDPRRLEVRAGPGAEAGTRERSGGAAGRDPAR